MTQQRATFRERDLDRSLSKQIKDKDERGAFLKEILTRPEIVSLSDVKDGPVTRYTTTSVLEAERQAPSGVRSPKKSVRRFSARKNSTASRASRRALSVWPPAPRGLRSSTARP